MKKLIAQKTVSVAMTLVAIIGIVFVLSTGGSLSSGVPAPNETVHISPFGSEVSPWRTETVRRDSSHAGPQRRAQQRYNAYQQQKRK